MNSEPQDRRRSPAPAPVARGCGWRSLAAKSVVRSHSSDPAGLMNSEARP